MNAENLDPGTGRPHAHLAPEDLLELALELRSGRAAGDAQAQTRACAQCWQALEQELADLERVQFALLDLPTEDERRTATFAERTLDLTTREDLSWRGDWRVVGAFLRERWAASLAVRLVAASLLLHLLALPVLALVLVLHVRQTPTLWITIDNPAPELPVTPAPIEPRRELVREDEPESPGPVAMPLETPLRSERLAQARRGLLEIGAPDISPAGLQAAHGDGEAVARLLDARSQRLGLGSFDSSLAEPGPQAGLVERALWVEFLLDDWALGGRADPRLSAALARLPSPSEPLPLAAGAEAELARHALERAASYGFELPGVAAGLAPRRALDRDWFNALGRACAGNPALASVEPLANWLAWGREHAR